MPPKKYNICLSNNPSIFHGSLMLSPSCSNYDFNEKKVNYVTKSIPP